MVSGFVSVRRVLTTVSITDTSGEKILVKYEKVWGGYRSTKENNESRARVGRDLKVRGRLGERGRSKV